MHPRVNTKEKHKIKSITNEPLIEIKRNLKNNYSKGWQEKNWKEPNVYWASTIVKEKDQMLSTGSPCLTLRNFTSQFRTGTQESPERKTVLGMVPKHPMLWWRKGRTISQGWGKPGEEMGDGPRRRWNFQQVEMWKRGKISLAESTQNQRLSLESWRDMLRERVRGGKAKKFTGVLEYCFVTET